MEESSPKGRIKKWIIALLAILAVVILYHIDDIADYIGGGPKKENSPLSPSHEQHKHPEERPPAPTMDI